MTYKEKVFKFLDELSPGEKVALDKNNSHHERFIQHVKEYIDCHEYGNGIEFNRDYTRVKKQRFFHLFKKRHKNERSK